jgi:hypothetical protein
VSLLLSLRGIEARRIALRKCHEVTAWPTTDTLPTDARSPPTSPDHRCDLAYLAVRWASPVAVR